MTPHDRYQRHIDLTGEIKQADQLIHECRVDVEAKQNALALAERALERQIGLRAEKHAEARRLAKEAYDDFMSLVPEDAATMEPTPPAPEWALKGQEAGAWHLAQEGDGHQSLNPFANPIYENGVARLNSVFEEATHP